MLLIIGGLHTGSTLTGRPKTQSEKLTEFEGTENGENELEMLVVVLFAKVKIP